MLKGAKDCLSDMRDVSRDSRSNELLEIGPSMKIGASHSGEILKFGMCLCISFVACLKPFQRFANIKLIREGLPPNAAI